MESINNETQFELTKSCYQENGVNEISINKNTMYVKIGIKFLLYSIYCIIISTYTVIH